MFTCFYPDHYVASIYDIPYEELWRKGVRGLFFDIDNTMAPYDLPRPDASAIRLFQELTYKAASSVISVLGVPG